MQKKMIAILSSIFTVQSCAHMSDKQKALTSVAVGAVTGAAITAIAARNRKDDNVAKDIQGNALIGAAFGGAYSLIFQSDEDKVKNAELEKRIKEAERNSRPGTINDGREPGLKEKCTDKNFQIFCSGNDPREPTRCDEISPIYLNKNIAIKYKIFYSPEGCMEDKTGPYRLVPELESYINKIRK